MATASTGRWEVKGHVPRKQPSVAHASRSGCFLCETYRDAEACHDHLSRRRDDRDVLADDALLHIYHLACSEIVCRAWAVLPRTLHTASPTLHRPRGTNQHSTLILYQHCYWASGTGGHSGKETTGDLLGSPALLRESPKGQNGARSEETPLPRIFRGVSTRTPDRVTVPQPT